MKSGTVAYKQTPDCQMIDGRQWFVPISSLNCTDTLLVLLSPHTHSHLCPCWTPVSESDVDAPHPRWLKSVLVVPSDCRAHALLARWEPEITSQQFIANRLRACDCQLSFIYFIFFVSRLKNHKASFHRGATTYMKANAGLTEENTFDVLKYCVRTPPEI